ncbi:3-hydroxyacyl-CoA dehydrogenase [Pyxidicoccus fallax]|uniref:3-hydroxyacyl-CoA dehydrogenase n=1 Tax=Pyxidicoccus fallax TaxID=394095 RepID=A0A848LH87_9BACT|nr:3-hydroxyacyl-CoA dehydrogenase [Pyxidicoccus fallax]NMO17055.1 3-hydroxyacyl-CoA dehydrogenase [Pyxidicoccus fallax]NPC83373.1 3-hydroxyacyl-CoA dehydrogenase [Pyxidicoccus fallax]
MNVHGSELILGIVGTGIMGRGIAQLAAQSGVTVRLFDARPQAAEEARVAVGATLDSLAAKGKLSAEDARAATARLQPVASEAALAGCHVVVEAIVEDLRAKQELFARLERIVGPDCLLATNTSSLSVTAIASTCERPGRVGGFHFFNPVPLMKVVEVIDGARTEPWVGEALTGLARRMGHRPVRAADTPGFIVNHAGRGFGTEALRVLQEGIASFDEIDRILREAAGFRMGPFELLDLTGLDVSHPVMESVYEQFYQEPRYRPSYVLRQRLAAGLLGRKSGRGFYSHEGGKQQPVPAPELPRGERRPVWVAAEEAGWRDTLLTLVRAAGWALDGGDRPAPESLCLVAPLGSDATTTALALGLDAERTVAVDLLFGPERRRTVMTTPVTRPAFLDSALTLLSADGTAVSRIHDSTGFVAQRVLATIVNIACDIAQQRIATPEDIDAAVTLGLGYPRGPLAWGDALGPRRLLKVLEAMHAASGDPRYRASPWLSRRARLGVSLLTPEN